MKSSIDLPMLIDQNRISIWVKKQNACWSAAAGVGFLSEADAFGFQMRLDGSDIVEGVDVFCILIPAWIKSEDIFLKHFMKEPNQTVFIFHDQVVHFVAPGKYRKAQLLIEFFGGLEVFDRKADGKSAEFHR